MSNAFETVCEAISRWQIPSSHNEFVLHNRISTILQQEEIEFQREASISKASRLDFLCLGSVAIEVKVQGSLASVVEQLQRYASSELVSGVILVTSRSHLHIPNESLCDKPFRSIWINASL